MGLQPFLLIDQDWSLCDFYQEMDSESRFDNLPPFSTQYLYKKASRGGKRFSHPSHITQQPHNNILQPPSPNAQEGALQHAMSRYLYNRVVVRCQNCRAPMRDEPAVDTASLHGFIKVLWCTLWKACAPMETT